jgi:hypothetical protein
VTRAGGPMGKAIIAQKLITGEDLAVPVARLFEL